MIHEALKFLVDELNEYLFLKMGQQSGTESFVVRRRLVKADGTEINQPNKVICQLINVEEERVGKAQVPISPPTGSGFPVRNPEIRLNLSVLFTALSPDDEVSGDTLGVEEDAEYHVSLKLLTYVIQFFQYRHYFTTENSPALDPAIGSLVVELYPISLENQNYLWATLGAKYRPSVVYKVRLVTIFDDTFRDIATTPRIVDINPQKLN